MRSGASTFFYKTILIAAAVALAGTSQSLAAGQTVTVSGDSKPSECGKAKKADFASELTGSLTGCMATFVGRTNCTEGNGYALYTEFGREEFEGKLDGEATKFDTQYTFNAFFPSGSCPKPVPEKEVIGGCIHYISADNLVGVIRFWDVMYGEGAPHYPYEGTLTTY